MRKALLLFIFLFLCLLTQAQEETLLDMVFVEGGTFSMGSKQRELHNVTVSSFYISRYEVTFEQYDLFCEENGRDKPYDRGCGRGNMPVINISWYDAVEFCNWLSEKEGYEPCYKINEDIKDPGNTNGFDRKKWLVICDFDANGYRLPTEAEWEYAARGGNESKGYIYSGSNDPNEVSWYSRNSNGTMHADLKSPNELGIYNMSGNVSEWCWDWYKIDFYQNSPSVDPTGPSSGELRVIRGGWWGNYVKYVSCTKRSSIEPWLNLGNGTGLRHVKGGNNTQD